MKQKLTILSSELKAGIGKKTGSPYSMTICQCIVADAETGEIKVGELTLPKDHEMPLPGDYEAEFKIGIDYQTKKIGGVLVALKSLSSRAENKPFSSPPKMA